MALRLYEVIYKDGFTMTTTGRTAVGVKESVERHWRKAYEHRGEPMPAGCYVSRVRYLKTYPARARRASTRSVEPDQPE